MRIKDTTWAVVGTDCGIRKPAPIFLDRTCARTRKQCIEEFEKNYSKPWAEMKKLGYRCAKFVVQGDIRL